MTIIAEYSPSFTAEGLATFLAILLFLGVLVLVARQLFGHQPPLHKEYATKKELTEVHGRIKRERDEVNKMVETLQSAVSGISRELDSQTSELNKRIDQIPQRTVTSMLDAIRLQKELSAK